MSKADKMLKELGYEKDEIDVDDNVICDYENEYGFIIFYKDKSVGTFCKEDKHIVCIDMEDLKAINEKVKELGWVE